MTQEVRIGYIRLKAEDVYKWDPIPRWLHINPIDMKDESPGSILCNIQFVVDSENNKRVFKYKGISSQFVLYAHIVSGFEIDPKNTDDQLQSRVEVEIVEKTKFTQSKRGRFPYWNELIDLNVDLDMKLDFAPDLAITLYQTNGKGFFGNIKQYEIGRFTVPIRTIKELKKYPHYFNLIKNSEKVGRILAMFYIHPYDSSNMNEKINFPIYQNLCKNINKAKIEIVIIGGRNLDFSGNIKDFELKIDFIQNGETEINQNQIKTGMDLHEINPEDKQANMIINICQKHEFITNIYGNEDFQIFPFLKITLKKKSFFGDDERFILFNLSDFLSYNNDKKKKLYRMIFDTNIDERKLDQEQHVLKEFEEKIEIMSERLNDSEEIILKDYFNESETPNGNDETRPNDKFENDSIKKENHNEFIDDETFFNRNSLKQIDVISNYKNMEISDTIHVQCLHKDKLVEMEIRKKLRLKLKRKLKYMKANDVSNIFNVRVMI